MSSRETEDEQPDSVTGTTPAQINQMVLSIYSAYLQSLFQQSPRQVDFRLYRRTGRINLRNTEEEFIDLHPVKVTDLNVQLRQF